MLPDTLNRFLGQGTVEETIFPCAGEAPAHLEELGGIGILLNTEGDRLRQEALCHAEKAWRAEEEAVKKKMERIIRGKRKYEARLGAFEDAVAQALGGMREADVPGRLHARDHTVYKENPAGITDRLGWLDCPDNMPGKIGEILDFVEELRTEGVARVLLLGMGGSSLAPDLFARVFPARRGYPALAVLDSTHPDAVLELTRSHPPEDTVYIVSTKSGGTIETLSFAKTCYNLCLQALGPEKAGQRMAAITDPGSGLEDLARTLRFRKIFLNDPHIGGRYSALSFFGMVPAAIAGVDIAKLLERARAMAAGTWPGNRPAVGENTPALLGAAMGELGRQGVDKLTLVLSPAILPFGAWIEQLVAESLGKEGTGVLPVDGEPLLSPEEYTPDRFFVHVRLAGDKSRDKEVLALEKAGFPVLRLRLEDLEDLGAEFFRWEMATALAAWRLKVNPFDQPNVEQAKVAAKAMMAAFLKEGRLQGDASAFEEEGAGVLTDAPGDSVAECFPAFFSHLVPGKGYVAIQAYAKPRPEMDQALAALREKILKRFHCATTVGYGPRYLHSTGQLHKGDAGFGLFVQIVEEHGEDVFIPDGPGAQTGALTYGILVRAQAMGDRKALLDGGRRVFTVQTGKNALLTMDKMVRAL
jgi:glucose-6-phosphate isomerase